MKAFKNILFPIDLSEASEKLVETVQMVAECFGARVHLLFVARILDYFAGIYVPAASITSMEKSIMEGAEKKLYEFQERYFSERESASAAVLPGDAAEEILKYVSEKKIDLIIMGTHGRKGLDKIIFGSVAERVVKASPVPVMVINPYKSN